MVYNNLQPLCFQICTHKLVTQSQCIAWSVAVVWHYNFLLMYLSSAARAGVIKS